MSSRRLISLLVGGIFLLTQAACLNDRAPSTMSLGIGKGMEGCLSTFDSTIRNYFNGRATEAEVTRLFDCATQSFDLFMKFTRGEKTGEYLPEELRQFFTRYFLGSKRISNNLLSEAMILKQAILGGADDKLTLNEVKVTIRLLNLVKGEALKMRKFMPLDSTHFNDLKGAELQTGLSEIDSSGQILASFLTRSVRPYQMKNFSSLLLELQQLLETGREGRGPRVLRDNLEVFGAYKALIFGGSKDSILPGEWAKIASMGTRWYSVFLRYQNLSARRYKDWRDKTGTGESWFHGQALQEFAEFGKIGYGLLNESLKEHTDRTVQLSDLQYLIDTLTEPSRLDWKAYDREEAWRPFDAEMSGYIKSAMVSVVRNLLGGYEANSTGRNASGITGPLFDRVWGEFSSWLTQQFYLEHSFLQLGGESAFDARGFSREQLLAVSEADESLPRFLKGFFVSADSIRISILDIRDVIGRYRPLFSERENSVYFPERLDDPAGKLYSFANLSKLNWIRAGARTAFRGYTSSTDVERAKSYGGLTEAEVHHLYWDFRSIGKKAGIFDPSTTMSGARRFREANLFTSFANGDGLMSLDEGTELFTFILSAAKISDQVHEGLTKICPVEAQDEFKNFEIESICYRRGFAARLLTSEWAHMPGFVHYFQSLDSTRQDDFMASMVSAAKSPGANPLTINHFETDVLVMLPHYIEAIFNRFDVDRSGTITVDEALQAYPVFRSVLRQFPAVVEGGLTSDDDLQAIFTFLLKEGRAPSRSEFLLWRYVQSWDGKINADRGVLLRIFALLASG